MADRILRRPEVSHITGLSKTTIYEKLKKKTFPAPVKLAPQTVGWRQSDIDTWIASLPTVGADEAAA